MGRPLDAYDDIAIATIVIYAVFLAGAVALCFKHGLARSSGWRFLIILALARLIGSAFRLATVSAPADAGLYVGWLTLNGLGLAPLILMLLGLLGRVFDSTNRSGHDVVKPAHRRLVEILMLVAIILVIVGGTQSAVTVQGGVPKIAYSSTSKAGTAIMVAVLALLCLELLLAFRKRGHVARGERRIIVGVGLSIPFVIVRLVYSCLVVFGGVSSNVWLYLGMLVIMEMIVVIICQVLGFSLDKAPPAAAKDDQEQVRAGQ
ncbi:hypothetical protein HRG_009588 [Hirsutella rhossiliensis]|uniref:DUF7702 domain-containing protein n=1 Tax=Hirsutella rhossiliensis TaxID=111463 RepID=A0A9P8MTW8_9HYPO|nr:uncharacterized protein HRG_09588 [Hirsutella rhossiliensis]KAH0959127.1 hypothetical protein HRG_09588 [Hirsutella rhossiliensis]